MGATLFLLLVVVGVLLAIGGSVLGTIQAFQVSTLWGLLFLFVPFAAFIFIAKFWNRERVRQSLFMILGGIVMAIAGAFSSGFLLSEPDIPAFRDEEEPVAEPIPLPVAELPQASPEEETLPDGTLPDGEAFDDPLVAADVPPTTSVELIRSTDPDERVQQVQSERPDPYQDLPILPEPPEEEPPPPVPDASTDTDIPVVNTPSPGGSGNDGISNGGGDLPSLPPPTTTASAVAVTGVVTIGDQAYAIVNAPEEDSSRYVQEGQLLSNGKVLVKRIETRGGIDPVVVLEENGVEVTRPVGGTSGEEEPNGEPVPSPIDPAAMATLPGRQGL